MKETKIIKERRRNCEENGGIIWIGLMIFLMVIGGIIIYIFTRF